MKLNLAMLNLASITLILKKDKPPDICGSFRPIREETTLYSPNLLRRFQELISSCHPEWFWIGLGSA